MNDANVLNSVYYFKIYFAENKKYCNFESNFIYMSTAVALLSTEKKKITPKRYTLEEFLVREERSTCKHEFRNGEIKLMAGGADFHSKIGANICAAIWFALKQAQKTFDVYNSEMGIYLPKLDKMYYADGLVASDDSKFWKENNLLLLNPTLIIEVASKSTRNFDREEKFDEYKTIPSFKEYILVEQSKPQVESRLIISEKRIETIIETDMTKSIQFRSLGIEISLADIYYKIKF